MQKISYKRSERIFDIGNFDYVRPLRNRKKINRVAANPNQNITEEKQPKGLTKVPHSVEKFKRIHPTLFSFENKITKPFQKKLKNKKIISAKISNANNNICVSSSKNKKKTSDNKLNTKQNINKIIHNNTAQAKHHYSFREKKTISLRNYITNTSENVRNKFKKLETSTKKNHVNQTFKNITFPSMKAPFELNSGNINQNREAKNVPNASKKSPQSSSFNLKGTNTDSKKAPMNLKLRNIPKKTEVQGEKSDVPNKDNKRQVNTRIKVPETAKHIKREGKSPSYNVSKKMKKAKVF